MKNVVFVLTCIIFASILLSGCKIKSNTSTLNYKRRFDKYIQPTGNAKKMPNNTIDLSDGPRLRYDRNFGPNDLNFDIKIKNPY